MKPVTRDIIEQAIAHALKTNIHAMDRVATMRGLLLAAPEVEGKE